MWDGKPSKEMVNDAYSALLPYEYEELGFVNWQIDKLEKASP
jgi:hypothetical protein